MTIAAIIGAKGADVLSIAPDSLVSQAVGMLSERNIGAVPVIDPDGAVLGIFSERDVIRLVASEGAAALDRPVRSVMTSPALTIRMQDTAIGALSLMTQRRVRHLPVVEGGRLLGIVSIGDLVKYRIDRIEAEAVAMRAYIQGV